MLVVFWYKYQPWVNWIIPSSGLGHTFVYLNLFSWAGTAYPTGALEFTYGFWVGFVLLYLVFCEVFYTSLLVPLSFIFWPLCSVIFDLRHPMTLLVYSSFSCRLSCTSSITGYFFISIYLTVFCLLQTLQVLLSRREHFSWRINVYSVSLVYAPHVTPIVLLLLQTRS
jgi:hypothetical protein